MKRMLKFLFLITILFATACADDLGVDEASETGRSVTLSASLIPDDNGQLPFLTPQANVVRLDQSEVVGVPYFVGIFNSGFAPGLDPPLHYKWDYIDESLEVSWTTPSDLPDGPYDVALVIYRGTDVSEEVFGTENAVVAINGDLATFTISDQDIRENDPPLTAGLLRVNVEGSDAVKLTENRWAEKFDNFKEGTAAFTDTILLVP